jgi:metal-responsive CopG/Arc/MetJ family transcriptional regulator
MPQADRHTDIPASVRLPGELKEQLARRLAETGTSRNAFIVEAVREKLAREAPAS